MNAIKQKSFRANHSHKTTVFLKDFECYDRMSCMIHHTANNIKDNK